MDKLREILQKQPDTCMNEELCSCEEFGWLSALLDLVDVTKPGAAEHLMKFFSKGKSQVLKAHHTQMTKDVCTCACLRTEVHIVEYLLFLGD